MFIKKIIALFSFTVLLGTSLNAKQQDPDMISYKDYKEKQFTHVNTAKKVNNEKKTHVVPKKVEKKIASKSFLKKK